VREGKADLTFAPATQALLDKIERDGGRIDWEPRMGWVFERETMIADVVRTQGESDDEFAARIAEQYPTSGAE
jgi:hypothetical protein